MKTRLFTLLLVTLTAIAQAELPRHYKLPAPDEAGDFSGHQWHEYWKVVDPDPAGLNARACEINEYGNVATPRPGGEFQDIEVVTQFQHGQELIHKSTIKDHRNRPWFVVRRVGKGDTHYLVRASKALVQPIYNPIPKPTKSGDWEERSQRYWTVVDPDPNGLNGRLHKDFPKEIGSADAVWPTSPVDSWPVVTSVPKGTILRAVSGHVGIISNAGSSKEPWMLMVRLSDYRQAGHKAPRFFVRAHKAYIQPYNE